jgi:hypothetical protein
MSEPREIVDIRELAALSVEAAAALLDVFLLAEKHFAEKGKGDE